MVLFHRGTIDFFLTTLPNPPNSTDVSQREKKIIDFKSGKLHGFSLRLDDGSSYQFLHDFVGSPVDGLDPGVDVGPGNGGLHHVAPTPVKLNAFGCDLE